MKKLIGILLTLLVLTVTGCQGQSSGSMLLSPNKTIENTNSDMSETTSKGVMDSNASGTTENSGLQLTIEELAQYNGKNGNPSYIAIDKVIYDVTDVQPWNGGNHQGYDAGQDLTEAFKNSPHKASILGIAKKVGTLVQATTNTATSNQTPTEPSNIAVTTPESTIQSTTNSQPVVKANQVVSGSVDSGITLTELAKYNGKNGSKAYIAVNGIIYDVTPLGDWSGGSHKGYQAGQDLTTAFSQDSPHTQQLLNQLTVIGKLSSGTTANTTGSSNTPQSTTQVVSSPKMVGEDSDNDDSDNDDSNDDSDDSDEDDDHDNGNKDDDHDSDD